MSKDQKRRKGRKNTNNKRGDRPQDSKISMIVVRRNARVGKLRIGAVIEFQGQPMLVRGSSVEDSGLVKLSLSRALKLPSHDREVKTGRSVEQYYEEWSFTTRPISASITVERFQLMAVEHDDGPRPERKIRKRAQASDRIAA